MIQMTKSKRISVRYLWCGREEHLMAKEIDEHLMAKEIDERLMAKEIDEMIDGRSLMPGGIDAKGGRRD